MGDTPKPGFWNTLPGLVTAVAALLTAIAGIATVFHHPSNQTDKIESQDKATPGHGADTAPQSPSDTSPKTTQQPAKVPEKQEGAPKQEDALREGNYELYRVNGAPQKKGIIMRIRKASDTLWLAEMKTPTGSSWNGEFRRNGDRWDVVTVQSSVFQDPHDLGGHSYEAIREGPLLTLRSPSGVFVWQEQDQ